MSLGGMEGGEAAGYEPPRPATAPTLQLVNANRLYQRACDLMDKNNLVQRITRIVMIGQQSMGKTTLLNVIMGLPIGFTASTTATKRPVEYNIHPSEPGQPEGEIRCKLNGTAYQLEELQHHMTEIMKQCPTISSEPVRVDVYRQNAVNAIFIDLPGIRIDTPENKQLTIDVAKAYCAEHCDDVYILVTKAGDDVANRPTEFYNEFLLSCPAMRSQQTIHVCTHAEPYITTLVGEKRTLAEIDADMRSKQVVLNDGSISRFFLELYQLTETSSNIDENTHQMYRTIAKAHQRMAGQLRMLDPTAEKRALLSTLIERTSYSEFLKFLDKQRFQPALMRSLNSVLDAVEIELKNKRARVAEIAFSVQSMDVSLLGISAEQSFRDFEEFCAKIVESADNVIPTLFELGKKKQRIFSATFQENLKDGHGRSLKENFFVDDDWYDRNTLNSVMDKAEMYAAKVRLRNEVDERLQGDFNDLPIHQQTKNMPRPTVEVNLQPGQMIRTAHPNRKDWLLGFAQKVSWREVQNGKRKGSSLQEKERVVTYTYWKKVTSTSDTGATAEDQSQFDWLPRGSDYGEETKEIEGKQAHVLWPMGLVYCASDGPSYERAWMLNFNESGLSTLQLVRVLKVTSPKKRMYPWAWELGAKPFYTTAQAEVLPIGLKTGKGILSPGEMEMLALNGLESNLEMVDLEATPRTVCTDVLFLDSKREEHCLSQILKTTWNHPVINNYAFQHLGDFLSFIVENFDPPERFSGPELVNLQESRKGAMKTAGTDGIVESLVQLNFQKHLIPLVKLVAAAGAQAMIRVFDAAIFLLQHKMYRSSQYGLLVQSEGFVQALRTTVEEFARNQAVWNAERQRANLLQGPIDTSCIWEMCLHMRRIQQDLLDDDLADTLLVTELIKKKKEEIDAKCRSPNIDAVNYEPVYAKIALIFREKQLYLPYTLRAQFFADFQRVLKGQNEDRSIADYLRRKILYTADGPKSPDALATEFRLFENGEELLKEKALLDSEVAVYHETDHTLRQLMEKAKSGQVDFLTKLGANALPPRPCTAAPPQKPKLEIV